VTEIYNTESKPKLIILRAADVVARTGLSVSSIYRLAADGKFPRPLKLGDAASGWLLHEVNAWIRAKLEERGEPFKKKETIITPEPKPVNPLLAKRA